MRLKKHLITEMVYPGNIGFEEMVLFYRKATKKEIKQMEKIVKGNNWKEFKILIRKVIGSELE